jgi:hypothetical protein
MILMRVYEVTYSMGCIATGGFFRSSVAARKPENIKGLLTETHGDEIYNLWIRETTNSSYEYEQVLTTVGA